MKGKTVQPLTVMPKTVKVFAATVMATTVVLGWNLQVKAESPATNSEQYHIHTLYHIYYGSNPLGMVDNKEVINQIINEAISKAEKENPHLDYVLAKDLTIIPEKTFDLESNNEQTISALRNVIAVKPHAVAIVIDGKPVVYVKNKADAEKVLHSFQTQFVPDKVLKQVALLSNNQMVPVDHMSKVETNKDSEIEKVHLSKGVSFQDDKVDQPSEIMDVTDAVHTLTYGDLKSSDYTVQEGDTLGGIAENFNMSLSELLSLNPKIDANSYINVGDTLTVKEPEPYLELVVEKEATQYEDIDFKKIVKENDSMYKGETKVIQQGQKGKKRVKYNLTLKNGKVVKKTPLSEAVLEKPREEIVEEGTKAVSISGSGELCWPAAGGISSPFGYRWGRLHKGIDISKTGGTNIVAADNGVVIFAGWDDSGYGNRIIINHNNGLKTTYNHLSHISVHVGQAVNKGQSIGVMGETGDATGIHLHFEVYKNGDLVNPLLFLP